jgi:hypothetical protein
VVACLTVWNQNQEPRLRHRREHSRPNRQNSIVYFPEIIEAPEREHAGLPGWQLVNRRRLGDRVVTPKRIRQTHRFFRVERIQEAWWITIWVGQTVVNARQASRTRISQSGNLHGSRLASKREELVVRRVQRQINQDVDPIFAYPVRKLLVG